MSILKKRSKHSPKDSDPNSSENSARDMPHSPTFRRKSRKRQSSKFRNWESDSLTEEERKRKFLRDSSQSGSKFPQEIKVCITHRDSDGEFLATPVKWTHRSIPEPTVLVLPANTKAAQPGIGDVVTVEIVKMPCGPEATHAGKVRFKHDTSSDQFLAIVEEYRDDLFLVPLEKTKNVIQIRHGDPVKAEDGDLVSAEITGRRTHNILWASVRQRICPMNSEHAVSQLAIMKNGIPYIFDEEALAEAEKAKPANLKGREDWRSIGLITIDPETAKDHDDAVFAEPDTDPDNPGGMILYVAIADVSHYILPGSFMDREAQKRGNSVYFPDRVIPMLPERISNDLCSLREGEDRPAMAVRMVFEGNGRKKGHTFHRVMMRSRAGLSYEQAQSAIDGNPDSKTAPLLDKILKPLWDAYGILNLNRKSRHPLDLDLPERKLILKEDGTLDRIIRLERLDAHRLIEEFMIQANVSAAETLEEQGIPQLYRIHDSPSLDKLETLRNVLSTVDIKLAKSGNLRPSTFNSILEKVAGKPYATLVNEIVLRSQSQAEYNPVNIGHFGLNLHRYAHFTSPIRRYADLTIHRGLVSALGSGGNGLPEGFKNGMKSLGSMISNHERRAMAAERETVDRMSALWICERDVLEYSGRITGVIKAGLFVELDEVGIDGFVPAATIGNEYFRFHDESFSMIGDNTGCGFQLGDKVDVSIYEVDNFAGSIRLRMVSRGRPLKSSKSCGNKRQGKTDGEKSRGKGKRRRRRR